MQGYKLIQFDEHNRAVILPGEFTDKYADNIGDNQMLVSDPDISFYATTITTMEDGFYADRPVTVQEVEEGTVSLDTVKGLRHYFLLADRYEISAKITKITKNYFRLSGIMGTVDLYIKKIRIGEPYDDVEFKVAKKRKKK